MSRADRTLALAWLALTTVALIVAAAIWVPWDWTPGTELPAVDPTAGLPADTLLRIEAYSDQAVTYGLAATGIGLVVAILLGLTAWGSGLARRLPSRWWPLQLVLLVAVLVLIGRVATLPLAVAAERLRREFGLSTQSWGSYTLDQLRGYAISAVVLALGLLVVLAAARWAGRLWWWAASLLAAGFVVAGSYVHPLVVEPLWNDFAPMADDRLSASLLALADEADVDVDEVLVADASRRTTAVNAYVSGFGSTRRIVVYDTLVETAPPAEVRQVVAHELGHVAADDVLVGTLLGAAGAAAATTLLVLVAEGRWVRRRAGVDSVREVAAVPLVLALVAVGSLLSLPAGNVVSRAVEARADRESLALTDDADTLVALQQRLAASNLSDPDPPRWRYLWFASHPTAAQRVALAEAVR